MKRLSMLWLSLICSMVIHAVQTNTFPKIQETPQEGYFPLSEATIYTDDTDYRVVEITATMLVDDVERVTGNRLQLSAARTLSKGVALVQAPWDTVVWLIS